MTIALTLLATFLSYASALVGGLYTLLSGWHFFQFQQALRRRGVTTIGRITHIRKESDADTTSYYPTVVYEVNGISYETEPHAMSGFEDFKIGKEVTLLYLPEKPAECTWRKSPFLGYLMMILGILILGITIKSLWTIFRD